MLIHWTGRRADVRTIILRGSVRSGRGDFAHWIATLEEFYFAKTGVRLFPGTLNLQLASDFRLPPKRVRLEAREYGGTVSVNIVPCQLFGRRAFILRTDANEHGNGDHPLSILEIASDLNLRATYGLADGDEVELILTLDS